MPDVEIVEHLGFYGWTPPTVGKWCNITECKLVDVENAIPH